MRSGHVCLSKNDFSKKKKINLFFLFLFLLSLATQSLKIIFLHFFTLDKDHPCSGGQCIISPSISSFISLGAILPSISFCLPHWGLTQLEYCSSKCPLISPTIGGFLIICVSMKPFSCYHQK